MAANEDAILYARIACCKSDNCKHSLPHRIAAGALSFGGNLLKVMSLNTLLAFLWSRSFRAKSWASLLRSLSLPKNSSLSFIRAQTSRSGLLGAPHLANTRYPRQHVLLSCTVSMGSRASCFSGSTFLRILDKTFYFLRRP